MGVKTCRKQEWVAMDESGCKWMGRDVNKKNGGLVRATEEACRVRDKMCSRSTLLGGNTANKNKQFKSDSP